MIITAFIICEYNFVQDLVKCVNGASSLNIQTYDVRLVQYLC